MSREGQELFVQATECMCIQGPQRAGSTVCMVPVSFACMDPTNCRPDYNLILSYCALYTKIIQPVFLRRPITFARMRGHAISDQCTLGTSVYERMKQRTVLRRLIFQTTLLHNNIRVIDSIFSQPINNAFLRCTYFHLFIWMPLRYRTHQKT
jgi:hypothetical protein